jgi:hypothetical protein
MAGNNRFPLPNGSSGLSEEKWLVSILQLPTGSSEPGGGEEPQALRHATGLKDHEKNLYSGAFSDFQRVEQDDPGRKKTLG